MTAFINVFAWILFLGITGWFGLLFVAFVQLTPYEQARAKITISGKIVLIYMASISWLISRLFA